MCGDVHDHDYNRDHIHGLNAGSRENGNHSLKRVVGQMNHD